MIVMAQEYLANIKGKFNLPNSYLVAPPLRSFLQSICRAETIGAKYAGEQHSYGAQ
ncbi:hypothetical protein ABIB06_002102 [Bradyrhizobium sp. LB8.2]